jgi:formate dehydrogenase subunit gamma
MLHAALLQSVWAIDRNKLSKDAFTALIPDRACGNLPKIREGELVSGVDVPAVAAAILDRHSGREGPLLPILHDLQEELGHVPQEALPIIARRLNLSRAEVHGVVSFYHDFREEPAGRHVLKVCRAEACQAMGADALAARLERELKTRFGETSPDGSVTIEAVYCLGLCATAPAAMLDGRVIGRIDERRTQQLLEAVRS